MINPLASLRISLKWKLTLVFVTMVILIMAVVTYLFTIREQSLHIRQVNLRMEQLANNIASIRSVETEDWEVYQTYADHQITLNHDIVYIAIYDETGQLRVHALNTDWIELGGREIVGSRERASIVWRLDQRQIEENSQRDMESKSVNIIIGDQNRGSVRVGFSLVQLNDDLRNNLIRNLEVALGFIAFAVLISLYVSYRIITPLTRLTQGMVQITRGNLSHDVPVTSRDEIGKMTDTFNFMTRGLREKKHLEDFTRELGFSFNFNQIASVITERLSLALDARKSALFILDDRGDLKLNNVYPGGMADCAPIRLQGSVRRALMKIKAPKRLKRLNHMKDFIAGIRDCMDAGSYALIYPMTMKDEMVGLYVLDNNAKNRPYTSEEHHFFTTLIQQAVMAVDNALLLEERTERERLKRELEIAKAVQMSLLPQSTPEIEGLDIDGICIPAAEVGGDYYDYFLLGDHRIGIVIADVTGKGTSAAFYMAVVKGMMTSLAPVHGSPKTLLSEINRRLFGIMDRRMFVTMNYALIDMKAKVLTFARAGHNTLMKKEGGTGNVNFMMPAGIGMGLERGETFDKTITEERTSLKKGDRFLLYTDGITEAMSPDMEEFGEERLHATFQSSNENSSQKIREHILHAVKVYTGSNGQHDDITMVTITAH